ncbi:MAG: PA14 domain-containing protein [Candidatus Daviesbacteria bacterium]|nr:PA14 domain-containing protein [Candidatus Daviesbacteria bacterium]MDD5416275.1 PA14 domain-containing protein [Candidatus Daviesbacteria bacterium]
MYFDPPAPKQDQPFTINVLSKGPSGRYLSIALDITTPLDPAGVQVVTSPSYPDIPSFYQVQGYQYSWQWLIGKAESGPTPYLFEFSINGRSQYCVSNILYVDPPSISAWIKASGDVHSNDWIRASGGPDAITYQGIICPAQSQNPRVTGGLITTYGLSDNFGNSEAICVVGSSAPFAPFKLLTYDDLKSLYFTQSKLGPDQKITLTGNQTQSSLTNPINLSSQALLPQPTNFLASFKNLIQKLVNPISEVFAQSAPACSGDICTDCLINNQGDPTAFLKFYEDNGWDISCGSQTGIIQNWCNATSEQATAQCNSMKSGVCAIACGNTPSPGTNQLTGNLWDGTNFNTPDGGAPSGPSLSAPVPDTATALDQNWGTGAPNSTVGSDTFSGRWQGNFTFKAGTYTFYAGADDGVRLKIDGVTRINSWVDTGYTERSYTQIFSSQAKHLIELEYYENGGDARVSLRWSHAAFACSGDTCTDCLISKQGDPPNFLRFYQNNGWDISCSNQTAIVANWCNTTDPSGCTALKSGSCATACGYVAPTPTPTPTPTPPVLDKLYHITGDLTVESNMTVGKTGIIFIDGNLSINTNLTHTSSNAGLVLAVKGDVTVNPSVTRIDAVIISSGKIYTAGSGCNHGSPVTANQLVINGSLISLDSNKNIEFCRTLGSNNNTTKPAELINNQPKYLVILRNLFSQTYQKWEEIP